MIYSRDKIIDVMKSWIGAVQGDATHKSIIDTYNAHKPLARGYQVKYTDAWCATTVSAAAIKLGYEEIIPLECSCVKMVEKAKTMGIWQENDAYVPSTGDIIMYDWEDSGSGDCLGAPNHVGYVEKVEGNYITVIEGNKNKQCARRNIAINGKYIRGYILPHYTDNATAQTVTAVNTINANSTAIKGIDTSKWQASRVDYAKAKKAGYSFVILRIGCNHTKDACFEKDYAAATAAGLKVGVYYAVNASKPAIDVGTAQEYAMETLSWLGKRALTMPIAFDIEGAPYNLTSRKAENSAIYNAFSNIVKSEGYRCMLYTGMSMYNTSFLKSAIVDPIWIARYSYNEPEVGQEVAIWQYTSDADPKDFYTDKLDRNRLNISYEKLMKDVKPATTVEPTPAKIKSYATAKSFDRSIAGTYEAIGNLNLRYGPDTDKYEKILVIPKGGKVKNYGYYTLSNGIRWYYVSYNGQVGFCSSKYLSKA